MTAETLMFTAPATCPDPDLFQQIVAKSVQKHFGNAECAAVARKNWQECQIVPEPFGSNSNAARHYISAQIALNPMAQRWQVFEEGVNREFSHFEDDGDAKEPAIYGWAPGWVDLA